MKKPADSIASDKKNIDIRITDNKTLTLTRNLEKHETILTEIAEELAYNYIMNSFGDKEKNDVAIDEILNLGMSDAPDGTPQFPQMKEELSNRIRLNQRCRNVVVLGAGASHECYPIIPLGVEMTEAFRREYAEDLIHLPFIEKKYLAEVDEVEKLSKFGLDFENFFQIMSNYVGQGELRAKIREYTGFKHAPSLLNEIVAHLLKHSFVDAVINFNFDELLDNAINEELGNDNYRKVVSDGDCQSLDELIVDGRLKVPLYIKPHGTFSHPSSLRFTKRQYLDISTGIENILTQLISGYRGTDENSSGSNADRAPNKPVDRINLILIGFNLASVEFNNLLEKCLPVYSKIYHLQWGSNEISKDSHEEKYIKAALPVFHERVRKHFRLAPEIINGKENDDFRRETKIYKTITVKDFNTQGPRNLVIKPYAEIMTVIWRLTHYRFRKPYQPRSISRHELVSYFFEGYTPIISSNISRQREELRNKYDHSRTFFLDRVIVDIAIALSRNDGIVDVVELLLHRVGVFFAHYTRVCENKKNKTQKVYSVYELLRDFAIHSSDRPEEQFMYSNNIFQIGEIRCREFEKSLDQQIKRHKKHAQEQLVKYYEFLQRKFGEAKNLAWTKSGKKGSEPEKLSKVESLIFHLLAHPKLSERFKESFFAKCEYEIYNGLTFHENGKESSKTLFDEIIRIFEKSSKMHYYHIQPKYFDNKNLLWETFSKKNISHTNLSFKYRFWELFNSKGPDLNCKWDIFLSILELGSILEFINDVKEESPLLQSDNKDGKHIILLCSAESSKQRYQEMPDIDFREKHINKLKGSNDLNILYMPYSQHNNHVNLFLKKIDVTEKMTVEKLRANFKAVEFQYEKDGYTESVFFEVVGSIYVHRRGFSNSINPINISGEDLPPIEREGLNRDNQKLMSLFFSNFCRAITFENSSHPSGTNTGGMPDALNKLVKSVAGNVEEIEKSTSWSSHEYHKKMVSFYYHLHKSLS